MYETLVLGIIGGTVLLGIAVYNWLLPHARKFLNYIKKRNQFYDDWYGEQARPGVPARQGVMERLLNHEESLSVLMVRTEELCTNSGESIKDKVNRLDTQVSELSVKVDNITNILLNK